GARAGSRVDALRDAAPICFAVFVGEGGLELGAALGARRGSGRVGGRAGAQDRREAEGAGGLFRPLHGVGFSSIAGEAEQGAGLMLSVTSLESVSPCSLVKVALNLVPLWALVVGPVA